MELLDALNIIKNECDNHKTCTNCPLSKIDRITENRSCAVTSNRPENWKLISNVDIQRLFK